MAEPEVTPGEINFTAEERYRLRLVLKAFAGMSISEMEEVKTLATTGKAARLTIAMIGRFTLWLSGAIGAIVAYKALWGKGS